MTPNRTLLLLQLARTQSEILQAASTDVVRRALLAARHRRICMRLGLAVPSGDLEDAHDEVDARDSG
jgi:hypothetical protein